MRLFPFMKKLNCSVAHNIDNCFKNQKIMRYASTLLNGNENHKLKLTVQIRV